MTHSTRATLAVAGVLSVVLGGVALGDRNLRPTAAPSVTGVTTARIGDATYRAVTGIERGSTYLLVEELTWTSTRARARRGRSDWEERSDGDLRERFDRRGQRGTLQLQSQRAIPFANIGNRRIHLANVRYLELEGWSRGRLEFSAVANRRRHHCTLGPSDDAASCDGTWDDGGYDGGGINPGPPPPPGGYPPPPPPPPGGGYDGGGINPGPSIERLRAASAACAGLFLDSSQRESCTKMVVAASGDLTAALPACAHNFLASTDRLACIGQAANLRADAAAGIQQCANTFLASRDRLACMRNLATLDLPLGVVGACASAFLASGDRLSCMTTVAGARVEAVGLIRYCSEQHLRGADRLRCLGSYR